MPRARAQQRGSRKKPKAPEGREGEGLSLEEKREKLEFLKKDFEMQVQARIEKMEKEKEQILDFVQEVFDRRLMQIPKAVREMKVCDFMAAGGSIEAALASLTSSSSLLLQLPPPSASCSRLKSRTRATTLNEIPEEPSESSQAENLGRPATGRQRGKRTQSARTAFRDSSNMPHPSGRSTRYRTPANKRLGSMGLTTPIITPKFDPRLPMTPGQGRRPQPGEQLLSLAGSPILNPLGEQQQQQQQHRSTIRKQGRTLTVNLDLEEGAEDLQLEGVTRADLERMLGIFSSISRGSTIPAAK